ncbi:MAG: signal peptidase I [Lachnospiraceae bacterium]|nr:signal peptidase I [Lachnospiraceae bacterium]
MNIRELRKIQQNIKKKLRFKSGLNFRRKRHRFDGDVFKHYFIFAIQIVAVIMLAWFITESLGYRVSNQGESMVTTIPDESSVWVDRFKYKISSPKVGDVIAFLPNGSTSASYSIKRIVAASGDTVLIENGKLYINGEKTNLFINDTSIPEAGRAASEITLKDGEYFVLGDNPENSEDSRYESVGNVQDNQILGKVWFICSLKGFGFVH